MIDENYQEFYAKEPPLATAKPILRLRAVFDEIYHYPVRFVSIGDYLKRETRTGSLELLTDVFEFPADRMYVSNFGCDEAGILQSDLETKKTWIDLGVPEDHIPPGNMKEDFWDMGETGCGHCSLCCEIYFGRIVGQNAIHIRNFDDDDIRILINREEQTSLKVLPEKHIGRGLELERLVSVIQDRKSFADKEMSGPLFDAIHSDTGPRRYGVGDEVTGGMNMACNVLADHVRTLTIALTDCGRPGDLDELSGDAFTEVTKDAVMVIINDEKQSFKLKSLSRGQALLDGTVSKLGDVKSPHGGEAWILYAIYGG